MVPHHSSIEEVFNEILLSFFFLNRHQRSGRRRNRVSFARDNGAQPISRSPPISGGGGISRPLIGPSPSNRVRYVLPPVRSSHRPPLLHWCSRAAARANRIEFWSCWAANQSGRVQGRPCRLSAAALTCKKGQPLSNANRRWPTDWQVKCGRKSHPPISMATQNLGAVEAPPKPSIHRRRQFLFCKRKWWPKKTKKL